MVFTPCKAEQPLRGMELQEKEAQKGGKEIPASSRFEFLEKFLANNFALSDAEDNTSGPLNRKVIADLPLLRKLLAIRQKSRENQQNSNECLEYS